MINMNSITFEATKSLHKIDETFLNTPNYLGLAYFWNMEYKHYMREASFYERVRVHKMLMESGLSLDGESEKHLDIVLKGTRNGRGMSIAFGGE